MKRRDIIVLLILIFGITGNRPVDQGEIKCSASIVRNIHERGDAYRRNEKAIEQAYHDLVHTGSSSRLPRSNDYVLPAVIYVVYPEGEPAGSEHRPDIQRIRQGLSIINQGLRGESTCPGDAVGEDTGIQLCLATEDIDGNQTDGVVYIENVLAEMDLCTDEEALKRLPRAVRDRFPHTDYINIYLVRDICASCKPVGCLAGGFAAFPPAHGTELDGIVLEANTWGHGNCQLNKIALHELGHYFNLYHTWEGGCKNDDCLLDGDRVCDTPPDNGNNTYPSNPCLNGNTENTCSTDVNPGDINNPFATDRADPTDNFMDYAPVACATRFTPGQVLRMQHALTGQRSSLLDSEGCRTPCDQPIAPMVDWISDTLLVGRSYLFTNATTGATTYSWSLNGNLISTDTDLTFIPSSSGSHTICLEASNGDSTCTRIVCHDFIIICDVQPHVHHIKYPTCDWRNCLIHEYNIRHRSHFYLVSGWDACRSGTKLQL